MDAAITQFHDYVMNDVVGHINGITSKKMFGGYGLYHDGAIFAIITSDSELYFKVDETNQKMFEERSSTQFIYTGHKNKKPTAMPYWILPEKIMEDKDVIEEWVIRSSDISRNNKK